MNENWLTCAEVASTQDWAWSHTGPIPAQGLFFQALTQTRGRGRQAGRDWVSPAGNLYLSWRLQGVEPEGLTLLGGLAVARVVQSLGLAPWLKWPNDCWVDRAKIAGVLADCRWSAGVPDLVLGIGLNVATAPAEAVALAQLLPPPVELATVTERLRAQLLGLLAIHREHGLAGYLDEVRRFSLPHGSAVEYGLQGEVLQDRVDTLDEHGFLRLMSGRTLASVDFLRPRA